jgi:hypothetical protein
MKETFHSKEDKYKRGMKPSLYFSEDVALPFEKRNYSPSSRKHWNLRRGAIQSEELTLPSLDTVLATLHLPFIPICMEI